MTMRKSAFIRGKIPDFSVYIAEPGGRWPPQHVNNEVGGANYLVAKVNNFNYEYKQKFVIYI